MNNHHAAALQLEDFGWTAHFRRAEAELQLGALTKARVMAVHRDALELAGPQFEGRVPPLFGSSEDQPTVGDWLALDPFSHKVAAVFPRFSLFKRRAAGRDARIQLIAANVDTLLIVTSANADFNIARLERYLVIASEAQVAPVVVITKADLTDDPKEYVSDVAALHRDLAVEMIDARDSISVEVLSPWMKRGQTIALLGSSGVGKSTLVNTLLGDNLQGTASIRESDARGRHTTTGRSLHRIPGGAWLLDTPGMRELQIVDTGSGIELVFEDVAELMRQCRFSDCTHSNEPGCAVHAALQSGTLDGDRLKRFEKLQREERYNSQTVHEAHIRDKQFGKMTRQAMRDKQRKRDW